IFLILLSPQIILSLSSRGRTRSNPQHDTDPVEAIGYSRKTLLTAGEYLAWLPPGLPARNLSATADGFLIGPWIALLAGAAFALGAASLEYSRLRADYYGRSPRARRRSISKQERGPTDAKKVPQETGQAMHTEGTVPGVTRFGLLERLLP